MVWHNVLSITRKWLCVRMRPDRRVGTHVYTCAVQLNDAYTLSFQLLQQLNIGGRLVVPVKLFDGGEGEVGGQFLVRIDKLQNGSTINSLLKHVSFSPLTGEMNTPSRGRAWPR